MAKASYGTFKSFDGTKISYRVCGSGKTTILCFNGIGVVREAWLPLEKYFSDKYRIISWDYRGHGRSGKPNSIALASFTQLVDDAIGLIKHLNIRKAFLTCHSAGLHVALDVLRRNPNLGLGLISCLGTPGRSLETFMDSFWGQIVFDITYILNAVLPETSHWLNTNLLKNPATYQIGAALRLVNPAIEGKKVLENYLTHITKMNFSLFNQFVATGSKITGEDVLPGLTIPVLLIVAEFDRFVPPQIAKTMHSKAKNSELFIIKNGTHAALFEQPDIFNLLIERFLNRLPKRL